MAPAADLFELFLALTPPRVDAARSALSLTPPDEATAEAALIPVTVDALLLGARGLADLALAVCRSRAGAEARLAALDRLDAACVALGAGDASGARDDESALSALAASLDGGADAPSRRADAGPPAPAAAAPASAAPPRSAPAHGPPGAAHDDPDSAWAPTLAEDLLGAFLDECTERLEGLEERLLGLEERGADAELINALFRDLHTLKGSSAFAGLRKLNRVAHRAEDRVGELREGKRALDRALVDVLLEALDVQRAIVAEARARGSITTDVEPVLARLADPTLPRRAAAGPAPGAATATPRGEPGAGGGAPAGAAGGTLRIEFEKVDQLLNLVGEVVLARGRLSGATEAQAALLRELGALRRRLADEGGRPSEAAGGALDDLARAERVLRESWSSLDGGLGGLGMAVGQLRDTVMKLRMVPIARLFGKYQRTARELSHALGKRVRVELAGGETELDKVLVERLEDPLLHLVRNAVDHGVERPEARRAAGKAEEGVVQLGAAQRGGQIVVTIADDGAGMDPARLRAKAVEKGLLTLAEAEALGEQQSLELIFRAGFSTAAAVTDVSGRGVGMDVVKDAITRLKGTLHLSSRPGQGSTVELRLPLTLAITQVLTARVGSELVALPLDAVVSAQAVPAGALEAVGSQQCLAFDGALVPVVDLAGLLGLDRGAGLAGLEGTSVVIVEAGTTRLGLAVQQVSSRHEVVVKSLGPLLAGTPCAAGATLVGDRVVLVLDLAAVGERARHGAPTVATGPRAARRARVLVAEDSDLIRELLRRELSGAGYDVLALPDGRSALAAAAGEVFDAVSTDVMMPGLDGYQLTRALRADPRYARVPIVMVTSKDGALDEARGRDAGADAYVTKPTDVATLVRLLDGLLGRSQPAN